MKTIRLFLNEIQYSEKYNKKLIVFWYWDNISKDLKPITFERYLTSIKDNFSVIIKHDNDEEVNIPWHRILRVTYIMNDREVTVWERTKKLNGLQNEPN